MPTSPTPPPTTAPTTHPPPPLTHSPQHQAKCIPKYVVNLSSKTLSHATLSALSKGLGFVPTPPTPNLSKLSEDIAAFARTLRIKYHFRNSQHPHTRHPFKPKSSWNPPRARNKHLEDYIEALSTDTPRLCTHATNNLSQPERIALGKISKRKDLVIKPADKGSCIVVQDTATYVREGLEHLSDPNTYTRLPGDPTPFLVENIKKLIDSIHELGYIDAYTHAYLMPPQNTRTQRMYFLKKLHKTPHGIRPIVSGCSGPTEHISAYIDSIIKPLVPHVPSYIKDSSHMVAILEETRIPKEALLVTIDVSSLYTNIPQDEGTSACLEAVEASQTTDLPTNILQALFNVVLKCNIFRFENSIYAQTQGTAMGTKMAPSYANLFMDRFERSFLANEPIQPLLWKRYIDDILCIWPGTREELDSFLDRLNNAHPTLRFTWSISDSRVEFLDLNIFKGPRFNNTNCLDLSTHFKKTNTFQYLHYSSSHPRSIFRGLVKGEAIRFLRSNTHAPTFTATKKSLRHHLLSRGYPKSFIDPILHSITYDLRPKYISSLSSYNSDPSPIPNPSSSPTPIPTPNPSQHPPRLVTTYSPYLPHLQAFLTRHWHKITQNQELSSLFPAPPQVCYRRNPSSRDKIVRAALPGPLLPDHNELPLTLTPLHTHATPCTRAPHIRPCTVCPKLLHRNSLPSAASKTTYTFSNSNITCNDKNIVYCIICIKCLKMYIGQTSLPLRRRIHAHIHSAKCTEKKMWPVYRHFHQDSHDFDRDTRIIPLEKCRKRDLFLRETFWIMTLETVIPFGLNSKYSLTG